uniref:Putative elongation factor 1 beta' n=1 Tax=Maconellicoccus hirsutus TaxID=177089 RepID=A2I3W8_MACHI|nr:putative elongation factor 1 beta' [Maconellicoccus hirsutus]
MTVSENLKFLENYLSERSYIEGYQPSQADVLVLNALKLAPTKATPNVYRWYTHIQSYSADEKKKFAQKSLNSEVSKFLDDKPAPAAADDDDVDLFGSDEDDAEAEKIKEERLKAYAEKKSKKPALIAKSSIILDVKPWDDETDMTEMDTKVRSIEMDGLVWGASKLVPVGYGIKKLQIICIVEDDKVSVDELTEKIQEFEDFVQSVDIAAFNKI